MIDKINSEHFRFKVIPEMKKIADRLVEDTGYINFYSYGRQYDDGASFECCSNKNWAQHFYKNYLVDAANTKKRLISGVNYWKRNTNSEISIIAEDARINFDMDARLEFVSKDEVNKCYHLYSFYSKCKYTDKAYQFYDIHRAKLLKFIAFFNREARNLIDESNRPENLVYLENYLPEGIENKIRNYASELERENPNTKISDREFETIVLYASGYTTKNIANLLNKSNKTTESHIHNVKKKYGFKDRISMKKYLVAKGYDGLERFFFNYFPESY